MSVCQASKQQNSLVPISRKVSSHTNRTSFWVAIQAMLILIFNRILSIENLWCFSFKIYKHIRPKRPG